MKVRIKTWEKLKKEYGIQKEYGKTHIPCPGAFVDLMENSMPKNRIITLEIKDDGKMTWFITETDSWQITTPMIEKVISD